MKKALQQVCLLTVSTMLVFTSLVGPFAAAEQETLPVVKKVSTEPVIAGATLEKWTWKTKAGTAKINLIEVDLHNPYIKVDALGGKDGMMGNKQTTSQLANERGASAAINGDFFTMNAEGAPFGVHIQSGEMITSPGYITPKNTFGLDESNLPFIGRLDFDATVTASSGATFQLFGINKTQYQAGFRYTGNSHINRLHMYTDHWNMSNWVGDSLEGNYTIVLVENNIVTQKLDNQSTTIPKGAYLLLGHGEAQKFLQEQIQIGDTLEVDYQLNPGTPFHMAIDGTSLLVNDGVAINHTTPGRNSRTAVGYSLDNRYMYMMTVEKSKSSTGMTFAEVGQFLQQRGAWRAVNLDGGGSTTMVSRQLGDFNTSLAMTPSQGSQRYIPNALGIFSTAPKGKLMGWNIYVPKKVLLNETAALNVKGYDEYYNPVKSEEIPVEWKGTSNPNLQLNSSNRSFVVNKPGNYQLTSVIHGKETKHTVSAYDKVDIRELSFASNQIRLLAGQSVQAKVNIHLTDGSKRSAPAQSLQWKLIGVKGTVSSDGTVQANETSVGLLVAGYQGYTTAVPVVVGSGEVRLVDTFTQPGKYLIKGLTSSETAQLTVTQDNGQSVGTLSYDFGTSEALRIVYLNYGTKGMSVSGEPSILSMKVKGDNSGHWLRAEFKDAKGAIHRVTLADKVNWSGWKTVSANLPQMAYPVALKSIYVVHDENSKDSSPNQGQLSFSELKVQNWKSLNLSDQRPKLVFTLDKKEVLVDGQKVTIDAAPTTKDGRTLLPLRNLSEILKGDVQYLQQERKVQVIENYRVHNFWLDHDFMSVNGSRKELDVKPFLNNGRTMLPLRAFTEAYGLYVEYDKTTKQIRVY